MCTFSYTDDDTFVFNIDGGIQGRIARIDANVARMYFVKVDPAAGYVQVSVPTTLTLHDTANARNVPVHRGEFLLCWNGNYELRIGGKVALSIDVERRQAIRTPFESLHLGA